MTRKSAAGPKTDTPPHLPPPNRTVDELNTQLALMTDAIRICLSRAVTDEDADDASSRDAELDNAVKLAEVSAHLTQAAARLKGEFQHRYKIIRVNGREAAQLARNDAWPQGLSEDEAANLSDEEILQRMLAGCPPKRVRFKWANVLIAKELAANAVPPLAIATGFVMAAMRAAQLPAAAKSGH